MNSPLELMNNVLAQQTQAAHFPSPICTTDPTLAAEDLIRNKLPPVLRISHIELRTLPDQRIQYVAVLAHHQCSIRVDWIAQQIDKKLKPRQLVEIKHAFYSEFDSGSLRIRRLQPVNMPRKDINVFETVEPTWVKDPALVRRAISLFNQLPLPLAHLVNAVFWDGDVFHKYCVGPSSLHHHHNDLVGNFKHSIDVAERCLKHAQLEKLANPGLLVAAALLHDAGKVEEYQLNRSRTSFEMTNRGKQVGHRITIVEMLAVARTKLVQIDDDLYLTLMNMLTALEGAPRYYGYREPCSVECQILSLADRLSGTDDIAARQGKGSNVGFIGPHDYGFAKTFVTPKPVIP
jgi:3'-5' exoribonuclease